MARAEESSQLIANISLWSRNGVFAWSLVRAWPQPSGIFQVARGSCPSSREASSGPALAACYQNLCVAWMHFLAMPCALKWRCCRGMAWQHIHSLGEKCDDLSVLHPLDEPLVGQYISTAIVISECIQVIGVHMQ